MRGRTEVLVVGGSVLALAGGLFFYMLRASDQRLETAPGVLQSRVMVEDPPGPFLVTIESVEYSGEDSDYSRYRGTVWDARSGARLTRVRDVPWRRCVVARGARLWCLEDQGSVELVGLPALERVASFVELEGRAGQRLLHAAQLQVEAGVLAVTLSDGKLMGIDPDTLALVPRPPVAPRRAPEGPVFSPCRISGTQRLGICQGVPRGVRVDPGDGFLAPELLGRGPSGWLVLADTSLDPLVAQRELVWLDERFTQTRRLALGPVDGWSSQARDWLDNRRLLVLTHTGPSFTVGIDLEQGRELWRVAH
jgi:hypothetical protein